MGHAIHHHIYEVSTPKNIIIAEMNEICEHETYREGGGGLVSPIRFVDKLLDSYDEALDWIEHNDKGNYDSVAVKYKYHEVKNPPQYLIKAEKKASDLWKKLSGVEHEIYYGEHPVTSNRISCKVCGSAIASYYFKRSNFCPVCHADMRPATVLDRIKNLKAKLTEARKVEAEMNRKCRKSAPYTEYWLVKIEFHT